MNDLARRGGESVESDGHRWQRSQHVASMTAEVDEHVTSKYDIRKRIGKGVSGKTEIAYRKTFVKNCKLNT